MPSIKDESTVEAIARAFCGEAKRCKTEALRIVGYSKGYYLGGRSAEVVWGNERVKAAIARIDAKTRVECVKSRKIRQKFWSDAMDNAPNWCDRLRASELLGRSEADFTDNLNTSTDRPADLTSDELDVLRADANRLTALKLRTG